MKENEVSELETLMDVYHNFPSENLLTFYGISDRFGFIYEWVDNIKYVRKMRDVVVHDVYLHDSDQVLVDGRIKYIDFWSDPAQKGHVIQSLENLGKTYEQTGDFLNALRWYKQALKLGSRSRDILNRTAYCLAQVQRH